MSPEYFDRLREVAPKFHWEVLEYEDKPNEFIFKSDEITFHWIDGNLWQFKYYNTNCSNNGNWQNPVDIINFYIS